MILVYCTGHCSGRYRDVRGGGGSAERKIYCIRLWKLAMIPFYNPLKSPVGAHVHKTTYGSLMDMTLYVMLLMQANPLHGKWEGVGPSKSRPQMALA
jgi:hypothetical protein